MTTNQLFKMGPAGGVPLPGAGQGPARAGDRGAPDALPAPPAAL